MWSALANRSRDVEECEALARLQDAWTAQAQSPRWKRRFEQIDSIVALEGSTDGLFEPGLANLLDYASKTVEYYHHLGGAGTSHLAETLRRFPVVDSSLFRRRPGDFVSKGSVVNGLEVRSTSGSTGPPMCHIQSYDHEFVFSAALRGRVERRHGIGQRADILDLSPRLTSASGALIEPVLSVDYTAGERRVWKLQRFDQGVPASAAEYARFGFKPYDLIFGAPSRIEDYVRWCKISSHLPRPKLVVCTYEDLSFAAAEYLGTFFECTIVNLYGATETGFLASAVAGAHFNVEMDLAVVEVLKLDADDAVDEGEMGRVVVTSLKSWAMPIIRYDTGDLARLGRRSAFGRGVARTLLELDGRRGTTFFAMDGSKIGAGRAIQPLKSAGIWPFQLVQYRVGELSLRLDADVSLGAATSLCRELEVASPELYGGAFRLSPEVAPFERTVAGKHLLAIQKMNTGPAAQL